MRIGLDTNAVVDVNGPLSWNQCRIFTRNKLLTIAFHTFSLTKRTLDFVLYTLHAQFCLA